jgi:hypothetical protein
MAQSKTEELRGKTQDVYEEVQQRDTAESVLAALQHADRLVAGADSLEELRSKLSAETAHLRDVSDAQAKLQETVGT